MYGLDILVRSLSVPTAGSPSGKPFQHNNIWQYHPRSDRHSKIACWAILFDVLFECDLLRSHVGSGKVAFGINHAMRDFAQNRSKNLDLVVCRTTGNAAQKKGTFKALVATYAIVLNDEEKARLEDLPDVALAEPSTVLIALEAKACMTEFGKARPRLFDELNSSHLTIHGDTDGAIAGGFAMVNIAPSFVSPLRNHWTIGTQPTVVTRHRQPDNALSIVAKLTELPRRKRQGEEGFDCFAIAMVDCANDGSPVRVETGPPSPEVGSIFHYEQLVGRVSHLYATRFSAI
jgi:hypothetical protein